MALWQFWMLMTSLFYSTSIAVHHSYVKAYLTNIGMFGSGLITLYYIVCSLF